MSDNDIVKSLLYLENKAMVRNLVYFLETYCWDVSDNVKVLTQIWKNYSLNVKVM